MILVLTMRVGKLQLFHAMTLRFVFITKNDFPVNKVDCIPQTLCFPIDFSQYHGQNLYLLPRSLTLAVISPIMKACNLNLFQH